LTDTRRLLLEFETDEVGRLARNNPNEMKALVRTFTDSSDIVRERALIAAVDAADPTVVNEITKSMDDDVANVRIAAAQALAFFHQPRTIPVLLKGLKDENPWVKSHCAAGLSKMLNGPIWARIPNEALEKMLDDFPDMLDEEINRLLTSIKMRPEAINQFLKWRGNNFDVEIDVSVLAEELEGTPILISEEKISRGVKPEVAGISKEVETILNELPDEIIATLPPEDLKRLTPSSAKELVTKLKVALPPSDKKKKKKTVKVRKVTKVKKKAKEPSRDDLIRMLPKEVRESVSDETLATLSVDELQALLASTAGEKPDEGVEEKAEPEPKPEDSRLEEFVKKYGEEKAALLITIPEVMLEGIPEEQIKEMDLETLEGLAQALEPR
jgi:hypothetical protein